MKILIQVLIIADFLCGKIRSQELSFTDTRKNKRFTGEIIAAFSDTKGNPITCLTHCLANKKKCKSINVNEELGKCELLGQSKLMDDGLEMINEEGWIYYGPGKTPEVGFDYRFHCQRAIVIIMIKTASQHFQKLLLPSGSNYTLGILVISSFFEI